MNPDLYVAARKAVAKRTGVTPSRSSILAHLAFCADGEGIVTISRSRLTTDCAVSLRTVTLVTHWLASEGLIEVVEPGDGDRTSVYRVTLGTQKNGAAGE